MRARGIVYEEGMQEYDFSHDTYIIKGSNAVSSSGETHSIKPILNGLFVSIDSTVDSGVLLFPESNQYYNFGLIYNQSDLQDAWDETQDDDRAFYLFNTVFDIYELQAALPS